jgi:hypothetical protein
VAELLLFKEVKNMKVDDLAEKYEERREVQLREEFVVNWIHKNLPKEYKWRYGSHAWNPCVFVYGRTGKKLFWRWFLIAKLQLPKVGFVFSREILNLIKKLGEDYDERFKEEYEIIIDSPR